VYENRPVSRGFEKEIAVIRSSQIFDVIIYTALGLGKRKETVPITDRTNDFYLAGTLSGIT